jgi:predicted N-acetyltransferase YhbS
MVLRACSFLSLPSFRMMWSRYSTWQCKGAKVRMIQATARSYCRAADYARIGRFLVRTYRTTGGHINWLQPRWEYMHYHPAVRGVDLNSIGVWEASGEIVGVVHPEHSMGTAYFEIAAAYGALKAAMLRWAEEHISTVSNGARRLRVYINDDDPDMQGIASEMGYVKSNESDAMSHYIIPAPFPPISLPAGFRLTSLAEDNDLRQVKRVFWRGFNHGDEPPGDGIGGFEFMQSAPNYRKDLNIVVVAPDGNFVSYCGMWHEQVHKVAYVEPVATDPDYRRRGLGRAAVLEGIRRCGERGAKVACVGPAQPFYLALGFRPVYNNSVWKREWT